MNHLLLFPVLLITLLPIILQANPYDVDYFIKNPDDIGEQLDICAINVLEAKVNGNLADVKTAKNTPACIAAKQARTQLKEEKEAAAQNEYEMRLAKQKATQEKAEQMAQQSTMQALQAIKENCEQANEDSVDCEAVYPAIQQRKKLDREAAIAGYRTSSGKMTELERFILLAATGECQKAYDYETCDHITRAQHLDEQIYRQAFTNDSDAAQAMLEKCKIPFMAAVAEARKIHNPGDRMREMGMIVNLKSPPFDNPLECKTAASVLNTSFGSIAYE